MSWLKKEKIAKFQFIIYSFMSIKSLQEQIADIKKAIEAQESMRSILGDSVVGTTLAVLHNQLNELERQSSQQDGTNQTRRRLVTVLFADVSDFTAFSEHRDAEDVANLVNQLWRSEERRVGKECR